MRKSRVKKWIATGGALAALALALLPFLPHAVGQGEAPRARGVVLLIGDGMGLSEVSLGRIVAAKLGRPRVLERFPTIGLLDTTPAGATVTDSAAAGTALACGVKARNGTLGLDAEGHAAASVLEQARAQGFRTGLVTTTRITHATPAAFVAHVKDRDDEASVAVDYARSGAADVLLGGGRARFSKEQLEALGVGKDRALATTPSELAAAKGPKLLGLFADSHLAYELERDPAKEPSLRQLTEKALDVLAQDGARFFLMVEGGRIDHACHHHDVAAAARDQLAFEDAVQAVLERFQGKDVLVVATADHATGNLGIGERLDLDRVLAVKASAETLWAKTSAGTDAAMIAAVREGTGVELSAKDVAAVRAAREDPGLAQRVGRESGAIVTLGHAISARLGASFYAVDEQEAQLATHGHEGGLVPLFATGPGAELLAGTRDNTTVPHVLARVLAIPAPGGASRTRAFR